MKSGFSKGTIAQYQLHMSHIFVLRIDNGPWLFWGWAASVAGPLVYILAVVHAVLWRLPNAIIGSLVRMSAWPSCYGSVRWPTGFTHRDTCFRHLRPYLLWHPHALYTHCSGYGCRYHSRYHSGTCCGIHCGR